MMGGVGNDMLRDMDRYSRPYPDKKKSRLIIRMSDIDPFFFSRLVKPDYKDPGELIQLSEEKDPLEDVVKEIVGEYTGKVLNPDYYDMCILRNGVWRRALDHTSSFVHTMLARPIIADAEASNPYPGLHEDIAEEFLRFGITSLQVDTEGMNGLYNILGLEAGTLASLWIATRSCDHIRTFVGMSSPEAKAFLNKIAPYSMLKTKIIEDRSNIEEYAERYGNHDEQDLGLMDIVLKHGSLEDYDRLENLDALKVDNESWQQRILFSVPNRLYGTAREAFDDSKAVLGVDHYAGNLTPESSISHLIALDMVDDLDNTALENYAELSAEERVELWTYFRLDADFVLRTYGTPEKAEGYKKLRGKWLRIVDEEMFKERKNLADFVDAVLSHPEDVQDELLCDVKELKRYAVDSRNNIHIKDGYIFRCHQIVRDNPEYFRMAVALRKKGLNILEALEMAKDREQVPHYNKSLRFVTLSYFEFMSGGELGPEVENRDLYHEARDLANNVADTQYMKRFYLALIESIHDGTGRQFAQHVIDTIKKGGIGGGNYRQMFERYAA